MIRVVLPYHLRNLVGVESEVTVEVDGEVTIAAVLDALEARYPVLKGTIRDHATGRRRPFLRFFACQRDFSQESMEVLLPGEVCSGAEPLLVVGSLAGG
ncbi:MAG: hypothetical protein KatS3mg081_1856 [Gemmatimonadales bacterium]|nr:MAG: hypothetical protein KatS3mg081_1856 [Gemmatimonadales bacterium]